MRYLTAVLVLGLLARATSLPAESTRRPLRDVTLDLRSLESTSSCKYNLVTVTQKGAKRESKNYGRLAISSKLKDGSLLFHDTITLAASYGGLIFERSLKYPRDNLLHPEEATLDVIHEGKSMREMTYANAEMKIFDDSGATNIEHWSFDNGILTFNALLRLAPLLPRESGTVYTFQLYAEPFLFRIREADEKDPSWTLTCEGLESIKVAKKTYECVKFHLELKSAEIRTTIWVGQNSLVVKFADMLPAGADADALEGTLEE